MASEFPFWDDDCLGGSINAAPLSAPPCSLFDNDLFCDESGVEDPINNFSDLLSTADNEAQQSSLKNELASPTSMDTPQTPSFMSTVSSIPSTSSLTLTTPNAPSNCSSLPSPLLTSTTNRQWRSFLDDTCPLRKRVKVTIVPSSNATGSSKKDILPSPVASAVVPSCPSTPPSSQGTGSSNTVKKPRNSQMRISAPRRGSSLLQTTFRVARPGEPAARITLDLPPPPSSCSPKRKAEQHLVQPLTKREKLESDSCSYGHKSKEQSVKKSHLRRTLQVREDDQGKIGVEFLDDVLCNEEPLSPLDPDFMVPLSSSPATLPTSPSLDTENCPPTVKEEVGNVCVNSASVAVPARKRKSPKNIPSKKVRKAKSKSDRPNNPKSFITASLQNRLSSMITTTTNSITKACNTTNTTSTTKLLQSVHQNQSSLSSSQLQPSRSYSSLPLVDAAVQAVARAAREYSEKLACSFPVSASAAATIVGLPNHQFKSTKRRKPIRRRRVLLSFDDRDVKPLVAEENVTAESVLAGFLNCSSPSSKKVASRV